MTILPLKSIMQQRREGSAQPQESVSAEQFTVHWIQHKPCKKGNSKLDGAVSYSEKLPTPSHSHGNDERDTFLRRNQESKVDYCEKP